MFQLKIIFSREFNFFKRRKNKEQENIYPLEKKTSIKNIIESLVDISK